MLGHWRASPQQYRLVIELQEYESCKESNGMKVVDLFMTSSVCNKQTDSFTMKPFKNDLGIFMHLLLLLLASYYLHNYKEKKSN